jgi:Ulp1 family protease
MSDFVLANTLYNDNQTVAVTEQDWEILKDEKGWLEDTSIDFMIRWYERHSMVETSSRHKPNITPLLFYNTG